MWPQIKSCWRNKRMRTKQSGRHSIRDSVAGGILIPTSLVYQNKRVIGWIAIVISLSHLSCFHPWWLGKSWSWLKCDMAGHDRPSHTDGWTESPKHTDTPLGHTHPTHPYCQGLPISCLGPAREKHGSNHKSRGSLVDNLSGIAHCRANKVPGKSLFRTAYQSLHQTIRWQ